MPMPESDEFRFFEFYEFRFFPLLNRSPIPEDSPSLVSDTDRAMLVSSSPFEGLFFSRVLSS